MMRSTRPSSAALWGISSSVLPAAAKVLVPWRSSTAPSAPVRTVAGSCRIAPPDSGTVMPVMVAVTEPCTVTTTMSRCDAVVAAFADSVTHASSAAASDTAADRDAIRRDGRNIRLSPSSLAIVRVERVCGCEGDRSTGIARRQRYARASRGRPEMLHKAFTSQVTSTARAVVIIAAGLILGLGGAAAYAVDKPTLSATVIDGASAYTPTQLFAAYRDQLGRPISTSSAQAII